MNRNKDRDREALDNANRNALAYRELHQRFEGFKARHPENSCTDVPTWDRLRARIAALSSALGRYGKHEEGCAGIAGAQCTCGYAQAISPQLTVSAAVSSVLVELRRQVEAEGFTPEHDDGHPAGELAIAGGCYALYGRSHPDQHIVPPQWPWEAKWWKPQTNRRDLVRAAALIIAEIKRLDRADTKGTP